jgi:hypothetical protein
MAKQKRPTSNQIERMYDSGENRVTQERNDFFLPQIRDFVREKKWLNLRPEYQRRLVWDKKKKSLFIESLLMNVPVPPVFLYESDWNRYEVMDGQQRLNAILEFYEDRLVLTGLETWKALNGLTYSECPPRIKAGLDRRRLSANVLLAESIKKGEDAEFIRKTVFERLNTGGQPLNAQELRNSLYSGSFNDLIIELAGTPLFQRLWSIRPSSKDKAPAEDIADNRLFKRMIDCEIVLRFFAFREQTKIRGSVRRILDQCMESNRNLSDEDLQRYRASFLRALRVSDSIFTPHTFQIRDDDGVWRLSQPLFDAVMVAVDTLKDDDQKLIRHRAQIARTLTRRLKNKRVYEIVVGKPNTASAVKERIKILVAVLKSCV